MHLERQIERHKRAGQRERKRGGEESEGQKETETERHLNHKGRRQLLANEE